MNKLTFLFKNAVKTLKAKTLLNIIVILSVAAGLFLPLMFIANLNYTVKTYSQSYYFNIDKTIVIEGFFNQQQLIEFNNKLLNAKSGNEKLVQDVGYITNTFLSAEIGGKVKMATVGGMSGNYGEVTRCELLQGRFFTKQELENGDDVALLRGVQAEIEIGDKILIGNNYYTIIGKVRDPKMYAGIVMPYSTFKNVLSEKSQTQTLIYATGINNQLAEKLLKNKLFVGEDNILDKALAIDKQANWKNEMAKPIKKDFAICFVLVTFSIISFVLITKGKFVQEKYSTGVKIAMGATHKMIFTEMFIQNFIIVHIAGIIDFILILIFLPALKYFEFLIDGSFFVIAEILYLFITFVITTILQLTLYKRNLSEILKAQ